MPPMRPPNAPHITGIPATRNVPTMQQLAAEEHARLLRDTNKLLKKLKSMKPQKPPRQQ